MMQWINDTRNVAYFLMLLNRIVFEFKNFINFSWGMAALPLIEWETHRIRRFIISI